MNVSHIIDQWYASHHIQNVPYWITQEFLYGKLDELPGELFKQDVVGESTERRVIRLLTLGNGKTPVLIWSQMHGDEPTGTRALLDLFSIVSHQSNHEIIQTICNNLTLYIIPMLNPDGAERFSRRTALGIDMNRDAIALRTPEARILKSVRDTCNAEWAYSLHDQEPRYTVGGTGKAAGISLLAAASDWDHSVTPIRRDTMRLASCIASYVQRILPDQIARYEESYEPRAFGDALHRWGTRSVLVESGSVPRDRYKESVRKANTIAILGSLYHLANSTLGTDERYHSLPINRKYFAEYVFRNASVAINGSGVGQQDVALYISPHPRSKNRTVGFRLCLAELGDCDPYVASYTFDGSKLKVNFNLATEVSSGIPEIDQPLDCTISATHQPWQVRISEGLCRAALEDIFRNLLL